jgi:flagellum-specific peptidoglycan hydrolase FlgJ
MTPDHAAAFLRQMRDAASGVHIWPEYAACEVALESGWGLSSPILFGQANNVFGRKQNMKHPIYETIDLPTHEWQNNDLIEITAHWVKYPTLAAAFRDRMDVLHRLSPLYPHYAAALGAPDGKTFILEVSQTWSTNPANDPNLRGNKVLAIFDAHAGVF